MEVEFETEYTALNIHDLSSGWYSPVDYLFKFVWPVIKIYKKDEDIHGVSYWREEYSGILADIDPEFLYPIFMALAKGMTRVVTEVKKDNIVKQI